jgi:DUF1365 family protein
MCCRNPELVRSHLKHDRNVCTSNVSLVQLAKCLVAVHVAVHVAIVAITTWAKNVHEAQRPFCENRHAVEGK